MNTYREREKREREREEREKEREEREKEREREFFLYRFNWGQDLIHQYSKTLIQYFNLGFSSQSLLKKDILRCIYIYMCILLIKLYVSS